MNTVIIRIRETIRKKEEKKSKSLYHKLMVIAVIEFCFKEGAD